MQKKSKCTVTLGDFSARLEKGRIQSNTSNATVLMWERKEGKGLLVLVKNPHFSNRGGRYWTWRPSNDATRNGIDPILIGKRRLINDLSIIPKSTAPICSDHLLMRRKLSIGFKKEGGGGFSDKAVSSDQSKQFAGLFLQDVASENWDISACNVNDDFTHFLSKYNKCKVVATASAVRTARCRLSQETLVLLRWERNDGVKQGKICSRNPSHAHSGVSCGIRKRQGDFVWTTKYFKCS